MSENKFYVAIPFEYDKGEDISDWNMDVPFKKVETVEQAMEVAIEEVRNMPADDFVVLKGVVSKKYIDIYKVVDITEICDNSTIIVGTLKQIRIWADEVVDDLVNNYENSLYNKYVNNLHKKQNLIDFMAQYDVYMEHLTTIDLTIDI